MFNSILSIFKEYSLGGGIAISIIGIAIYLAVHIFERRDRLRWQEFKTYHGLVKQLAEGNEEGKKLISRQTAVIYELCHFKRYYEHSLRLLKYRKERRRILEKKWETPEGKLEKTDEEIAAFKRVLKRSNEEMDMTIEFIEGKIKRKLFMKFILILSIAASIYYIFYKK